MEMKEHTGERIVLRGRKIIGGFTEGEALVSKGPLMGWGNVDEKNGYTVEREHSLYEIPFSGKVLVFTEPRGSGGFIRYGKSKNFGKAPLAFVYRKGCSLTILAAMNAGIPTVCDFDQDPSEVIESGDYVIVNADEGIVEVVKRDIEE